MSNEAINGDLVRALATLLDETKLSEIEYEVEGVRIRVARNLTVAATSIAAPVAVAAPAAAGGGEPAHDVGAVLSPMVGVAYMSPEPGAPAFVKLGDSVAEGQTLLLIEAMKTYNAIRAPRGGKVTRLLVQDGQPVEYGEPLLVIGLSMFTKILIANRGEIALRIHRACHEMGIRTVAVHSTADHDAMHVRLADESVCIGPPAARDSYLNKAAIISAATITGAEAIHPGYGFLSENADFAQMVEDHGIVFIGPSPSHIRMMGDKITAKEAAKSAGLPVVPGSSNAIPTLDEALALAEEVGYPLLIKAVAGGGGRGMKMAASRADLADAFRTARSEALSAFGNGDVYIEKFLDRPRHIELQILADAYGNVVHLGERDCSLQRRHQKLLEEAPSPALTAETRESFGRVCCEAIRKLGYKSAGTLEFLYSADGSFNFIEMNTRLQVEHPVTEAICGIDIVREQIRIAAGEPLGYTQEDIVISGHAIECRINAEDPETFAPSPGRVGEFHPPGGLGVRVDSALYAGYRVPPYYDSMIAKLIVHGTSRADCLARMRRSLEEFVIEGVKTTIPLHQRLFENPEFIAGEYHIRWLEDFLRDKH